MQTFPDIMDDLGVIIETLIGENAVDISNLENQEVSEFLASLLGSLGIKEGEDGNHYYCIIIINITLILLHYI